MSSATKPAGALTVERVRERLAARVIRPAFEWPSDPAAFPAAGPEVPVVDGAKTRPYRPAAVLVPLILPPSGDATVLLTKRPDTLRMHKGEIRFPGGTSTPGDGELLATALREADEELGIAPADVTVLGPLDPVPTITGYLISPFVGVIDENYPLRPSAAEIAALLRPTLRELSLPENRRSTPLNYGAVRFTLVAYAVDGGTIWGATARILQDLLEALASDLA